MDKKATIVGAFNITCVKGCCNGCPVSQHTEEGMMVSDLGCLPSFGNMLKWYSDTGKVWACHEDNNKPCVGFIKAAKAHSNVMVKVSPEKGLITESMTIKNIYDGHTNQQDF